MNSTGKAFIVLAVMLFAAMAIAAGATSFKVQDIVLTPDAGGGITFPNGSRQTEAVTPTVIADASVNYSNTSGTANTLGTDAGYVKYTDLPDASVSHAATATTATTMATWDGGSITPNGDTGVYLNGALGWSVVPTTPAVGAQGAVQYANDGGFGGAIAANYVDGTDGGVLTIQQRGGTSIGGELPGLRLENPDIAIAGTQQYSPTLDFIGSGWGTTPGAQSVKYRVLAIPVQGTTAPSVNLAYQSSVGGAAYTTVSTLSGTGSLTATSISSGGSSYGGNCEVSGTMGSGSSGSLYTKTTFNVGLSTAYGSGGVMQSCALLTSDATPSKVVCSAMAAIAAESCAQTRAMCEAINKANTAEHASYDKEVLCCNKEGTTTCDAITSIREQEAVEGWNMTFVPCDEASPVSPCTAADTPIIQVTGENAKNINWKCYITTMAITNG